MGKGKNKLNQRRNQALYKKQMLEQRQELILELKRSGVGQGVQENLVSYQKPQIAKERQQQPKSELPDAEAADLEQETPVQGSEYNVPELTVGEHDVSAQPRAERHLVYTYEYDNEDESSDGISDYPEKFVGVEGLEARPPQFERPGRGLPIEELRGELEHMLQNRDVVAVEASTGSGKSTQVPRYLLELGYGCGRPFYEGRVLVTEPRRIAAAGLWERLREEAGTAAGLLGYAVRGGGANQANCRLCVVTEGVLGRLLEQDALLTDYAAVILDEAHERSQDFDVALGCLSRAVRTRRRRFETQLQAVAGPNAPARLTAGQYAQISVFPLKLVLMSATLDARLLGQHLFPRPPRPLCVVRKAFPIAVHYLTAPAPDYVTAALRTVLRIHRGPRGGGILVFLTGHAEITRLVRLLADHLDAPVAPDGPDDASASSAGEDNIAVANCVVQVPGTAEELDSVQPEVQYSQNELHTVQVAPGGCVTQEELEQLRKEYEELHQEGKPERERRILRPIVLPLHGQLPMDQQQLIYQSVDQRSERLIIIATNVAESSLTIPDVKFVVDTCRAKVRVRTSVGSRLAVQFCAEANLIQRAGRAGRVSPGHCFRLITPGEMSRLDKQPQCEIERLPIDSCLIRIIKLGYSRVERFPFPTSPGEERIRRSMEYLHGLNIVVGDRGKASLSEFGKTVSEIPLDVGPAHVLAQGLLVSSDDKQRLGYFIMFAAAMSVEHPFVLDGKPCQYPTRSCLGDMVDKFMALGAFLHISDDEQRQKQFCAATGLRYEAFAEMQRIYQLLARRYGAKTALQAAAARPDKGILELLQTACIRANLQNIAFKEDGSAVNYQIGRLNIFDYLNKDDINTKLGAEQARNNIIDTAKIGKISYYFTQQQFPEIVCYQSSDVVTVEKDDHWEVQVYLGEVTAVEPCHLMDLAEFSPFVVTGQPDMVFMQNNELFCTCMSHYDSMSLCKQLGVIECSFPGRGYFNNVLGRNYALLNRLIVRMHILLLLYAAREACERSYTISLRRFFNHGDGVRLRFVPHLIDKIQLDGLVEVVAQQYNSQWAEKQIHVRDVRAAVRCQAFRVKGLLGALFVDNGGLERFWSSYAVPWVE